MKRMMTALSKTEFGIYWYCVLVDFRKNLRETLSKKSIIAWFALLCNIAIVPWVQGTKYEVIVKAIIALLTFLA